LEKFQIRVTSLFSNLYILQKQLALKTNKQKKKPKRKPPQNPGSVSQQDDCSADQYSGGQATKSQKTPAPSSM